MPDGLLAFLLGQFGGRPGLAGLVGVFIAFWLLMLKSCNYRRWLIQRPNKSMCRVLDLVAQTGNFK